MDQHAAQGVALDMTVVDQLGHERDGAHFAHQGRIEADLVDAVHDLVRRGRHLVAQDRVDVHDNDVGRCAVVDQREDRGIAHVAAVPVVLALDLDRVEHERQAGRGERAIDGHLVPGEDLDLAGAHVGRAQEELERPLAHPLEIDRGGDDVAQRVEVERIELIGRKHLRHQVHDEEGRRQRERVIARQPLDRQRLQRTEACRLGDACPERGERLARRVAAAARQTAGEHHGIHRAGRSGADALEGDALVLEEAIEHAPGEGAMRTTALEGEVDRFHRHVARGVRCRVGVGAVHVLPFFA
jgi:hypothetical protein